MKDDSEWIVKHRMTEPPICCEIVEFIFGWSKNDPTFGLLIELAPCDVNQLIFGLAEKHTHTQNNMHKKRIKQINYNATEKSYVV